MWFRQQVGLIVCFLECLLFGGTLYGWPSLVYVFKDDGVYSHACLASANSSPKAQAQSLPNNITNTSGTTMSSQKAMPFYTGTSVSEKSANVSLILNTTSKETSLKQKQGSKEILSHIQSVSCAEQDTHLALAVILAVLVQGVSALPAGRIFDKFGLRITRTMATVLGFIGYNLLAFVQEGATSWLVYPGCICLGIAQNIIMMTNCYVTELVGSRASTLVALYNGAMLASSGVLLLVKLGHDHGVQRTTSMTILGGLWIITIVNTFTFLPKRKILKPASGTPAASSPDTELSSATPYITSNNNDDNSHDDVDGSDANNVSPAITSSYVPAYELSWTRGLLASEPSESEFEMSNMGEQRRETQGSDVNKLEDDSRGWLTLVKSSLFISYLYWFCALHFRVNVFISAFSLWVRLVVKEDKERESHFTDIYGYLNIAGIVLSPLPGLLIDYRRRKLARNERFGLLGAMAATPALTFSTAVAIVMGLTSMLNLEAAIYLSTVMCVILRACLYPTGTAFIGLVWPSRVYGSLFGVTFTLLGVIAFLQYPFVIWARTVHRGNISMNALLLLLTLLSFLLPGHVLFKYRKRKDRHNPAPTTNMDTFSELDRFRN